MEVSCAWIGDHHGDEWQHLFSCMQRLGHLQSFDCIGKALDADAKFDMAILPVDRPGALSVGHFDSLQNAWQQTRVVFLLSDACSGMRRTSPDLADRENYYACEFRSEIQLSRLLFVRKKASRNAPLAATANSSEQTVEPRLRLSPPHELSRTAVYARTQSYRETLVDVLSSEGHSVCALEFNSRASVTGIDVVVWEANPHADEREAELDCIRIRHPQAQVIALMTYPRQFEHQAMAEQGVQVLAQPFRNDDLLASVGWVRTESDRIPYRCSA